MKNSNEMSVVIELIAKQATRIESIEQLLLHLVHVFFSLAPAEFVRGEGAVGLVDQRSRHERVRVCLAEIPHQPVITAPFLAAAAVQ